MLRLTGSLKGRDYLFLIMGLIVTVTASATPGHVTGFGMPPQTPQANPASTCEEKLSSSQTVVKQLTSRKKNLTIITGETDAIETLVEFSLSGLEPEFEKRTIFVLSDETITETGDEGDIVPKENWAALKLPIEERMGNTETTKGILLRDWLNNEYSEPTIRMLSFSANQLSLRQQRELLEIYNSLPDDLDLHLFLYSNHPENIISGFREKTEVIHADNSGAASYAQKRGTHLRQLADLLLKPKTSQWGAKIILPSMQLGQSFTIDLITLIPTLTKQEVEFFLMQPEPPTQEGNENRPAFVQIEGFSGSVQSGMADSDRSTLEVWDDIVSSGPNKNNLRLIMIPTQLLTESEQHTLKKWIAKFSERKDAHLYRLIFLMKE